MKSSHRPRTRIGLAAVSAIAVVAPLTSVGSPATAQTKTMQAVAKATGAAKTMQFSMNIDMSFPVSGKTVKGTINATGRTDKPKKASAIDMDLASFMKAMTAGSGTPLPAEMSDPKLFKMQMITVDTKMWMKFPLLNMTGGDPAKPWVLLDAKKLGVDADALAASQGADPGQGLDMLAGLSANAKEVGKEKVRGVDTTKYSGTVEVSALTKNLPADQAEQARAAFGGKSSLPISVWVDSENRARRISYTATAAAQGISVNTAATYEFFAFNEPVSITPPPAGEVGVNPMLEQILASSVPKKKPVKKAA
jgi:hypothetical protein